MTRFIADYMEHGFLENIIDMFKHDRTLYPVISDLISDERGRVRIGTVALVEELMRDYEDEIIKVIPHIARNLTNEDPTIRGDTAYLLGLIGHKDAIPYLMDALNDEDTRVKEVIEEAIGSINGNGISDPE
ncbi:MAG: HEAT repeat domain-containing protein [Thermodesulfovibrionia bacterium]